MLQQIDSAIAFAVVMLILSMIITALVQIVLASFDLRGLNLVWALTRLFHQVDPSFRAKASEIADSAHSVENPALYRNQRCTGWSMLPTKLCGVGLRTELLANRSSCVELGAFKLDYLASACTIGGYSRLRQLRFAQFRHGGG